MAASSFGLYKAWRDPVRKQALAEAYTPIVRGFLLPGCAYYALVTWGHWQDEKGLNFAILASLSTVTAISYYLIRERVLSKSKTTIEILEASGLATNLLMYTNVVAYMLVHFEQAKLVYFSLMAVVFSTTGVTLRATLFSIGISLAGLYWFARGAAPEVFSQSIWIGVATAFAAFGLASLLRRAILKQIDARLTADELAAKAQDQADTDTLTGIPNRRAMFHRIDHLVAAHQTFWIGIVDLDGFKAINDLYGHAIGDKLLCAVVERARGFVGQGVTFGRLGGDEFIAVGPGSDPAADLVKRVDKAIQMISAPYQVEQMQLSVGASAGVAHFPSMGSASQELYERADFALYKAKARRRGHCVLFNVAEAEEMKENLAIVRALREGDLERELYLLFQPQFSLRQERITSFEALARWESASLGPIGPDRFIRGAERSGIIRNLTAILFRKVLVVLKQWPERLSVSFNLSAHDIADHSFVLSLLDEVCSSGVATARVEFEITETAVMSDLDAARTLLTALRTAGCKIALDDFGSGYSSLQYLDVLPLDKVKIDKSFVRKVARDGASHEIVAAVISLCKKLKLRCVLEGVETHDEMKLLAPLKPDLIQGYLFGKPMRAEEALEAAGNLRRDATRWNLVSSGSKPSFDAVA